MTFFIDRYGKYKKGWLTTLMSNFSPRDSAFDHARLCGVYDWKRPDLTTTLVTKMLGHHPGSSCLQLATLECDWLQISPYSTKMLWKKRLTWTIPRGQWTWNVHVCKICPVDRHSPYDACEVKRLPWFLRSNSMILLKTGEICKLLPGVNILVKYGAKHFRLGASMPWEVRVKISGL